MKPLLALNHRQLVLDSLPAGGTMLEWGCGGSTSWFLAQMEGGGHSCLPAEEGGHSCLPQKLISVEHDEGWLGQCEAHNHSRPGRERWTPLLKRSTLPVGRNATHWEECPAGLERYICPLSPAELASIDVFLVDGVARAACLATVALYGSSGAAVYCHDLHRNWYDWILSAPRFVDRQLIDADAGEYPPPLWSAKLA
jgi:hypothetical protein